MATILNTQSIITVPQINSIATDGSSTIYVNEDKQQLRQIPVNDFIASIKQKMCDMIYPVGAIYISTNSKSPAELFGGTWQKIEGRFLLGASSTYKVNATGGSADAVVVSHSHSNSAHTHTIASHTHSIGNHTHSIGNHYHEISLTSGGASQGHTHNISITSGANNRGHTHTWSGANAHSHRLTGGNGYAITVENDKNYEHYNPDHGFEHSAKGNWWLGSNKSVGKVESTTITMSGTTSNVSQSHTHSVSGATGGQSQGHTHSISGSTKSTVSGNTGSAGSATTSGSGTLTTSKAGGSGTGTTGQSGTGKNMPPYVAVYMWKRVS